MSLNPLALGPPLAAATNGGGSLLRDILRHQPSNSLRTTQLSRLEISILFLGLVLSVFLIYYSSTTLPTRLSTSKSPWSPPCRRLGLTRFLTIRNNFTAPGIDLVLYAVLSQLFYK